MRNQKLDDLRVLVQMQNDPNALAGFVHLLNVILRRDLSNVTKTGSRQLVFDLLQPLLPKKGIKKVCAWESIRLSDWCGPLTNTLVNFLPVLADNRLVLFVF